MFVSAAQSQQPRQIFLAVLHVQAALWKWSCLVFYFINHCQAKERWEKWVQISQIMTPGNDAINSTENYLIFISPVDLAELRPRWVSAEGDSNWKSTCKSFHLSSPPHLCSSFIFSAFKVFVHSWKSPKYSHCHHRYGATSAQEFHDSLYFISVLLFLSTSFIAKCLIN